MLGVHKAERIIVTEFATHGSLLQLLNALDDEGREMAVEQQLSCFTQIASGMEALASRGITHRDLAARNVLVFDATSLKVKVADFGLAVNQYGPQTVAGDQVPYRWLAPESLRRRRFSEKSDVWAFGVTM